MPRAPRNVLALILEPYARYRTVSAPGESDIGWASWAAFVRRSDEVVNIEDIEGYDPREGCRAETSALSNAADATEAAGSTSVGDGMLILWTHGPSPLDLVQKDEYSISVAPSECCLYSGVATSTG